MAQTETDSPQTGRPGPDWVSIREATALIGVSPDHFYRQILPIVAEEHTTKRGGRRWVIGRAVVEAHMARIVERVSGEDSDPLMVGGSGSRSPALERYRAEKALLAKMEREEKEGSLIPRDLIRRGFTVAAGLIRQAGEILQRDFGTAAADVLNRALDDAEREIDHSIGRESRRASGRDNQRGARRA